MPDAPLFEGMLTASRQPPPALPPCPAMARARREALASAHSPRRLRNASREFRNERDPIASIRRSVSVDKRGALASRKSEVHQLGPDCPSPPMTAPLPPKHPPATLPTQGPLLDRDRP